MHIQSVDGYPSLPNPKCYDWCLLFIELRKTKKFRLLKLPRAYSIEHNSCYIPNTEINFLSWGNLTDQVSWSVSKFPHDSTKYYGGPITAYSDKFNVTWRDVTWRDVTWRDVTQHFLHRVPWLNYFETFWLYGLHIMDVTVAQQFCLLEEKLEIQKKKNSLFSKSTD